MAGELLNLIKTRFFKIEDTSSAVIAEVSVRESLIQLLEAYLDGENGDVNEALEFHVSDSQLQPLIEAVNHPSVRSRFHIENIRPNVFRARSVEVY